jgi:hypothetical protein
VLVQVIVPLLTPEVKEIVGMVLFKVTVTTFDEALLAQPLVVFVTTTLYEPAAVKLGFAVVCVPGTIPVVGLQL